MSKNILRVKSGLYILLLSAIGFLGTLSFSSCKGKEKTSNTDKPINNNSIDKPVTKYGVPANYNPQPQPTKYGVEPQDYLKKEE